MVFKALPFLVQIPENSLQVKCHYCKAEFIVTLKEYNKSRWKKFWCSDECKMDDRTYRKFRRRNPAVTTPEKKVAAFIRQNKLPYRYTGDGTFWLEKVNPDFININGEKKAIEVFGCYWHKCPHCFPNVARKVKNFQTEQGRKELFKKYGWDVIILWEHDLVQRGWRTNLLRRLTNADN